LAAVSFDLVPPDIPGLTKLKIYEAPAATGPWTLIETVTTVGSHPDYISRYSTTFATNVLDWFSVRWEDAAGVQTDQSQAVQGGTLLVLSKIVQRVLTRDPALDEIVVTQIAEAILEKFYGDDPYTIMANGESYAQMEGLTLLILARTYIQRSVVESQVDDFTAGLVSLRSGTSSTTTSRSDPSLLVEEANSLLNINYSVVMLHEEIEIGGGMALGLTVDQSRLIYELP
jgi:hypothetical protein